MRRLHGPELAHAAKAAYDDAQRVIGHSTNKWYAYASALAYGPAMAKLAAESVVRTLTTYNWTNKSRLPLVLQWARAARIRGYGNCGDYTPVAFQHLMDKDIGPLDYVALTGGGLTGCGDHEFCVLGRAESSDPTAAAAWGTDVWVIDGWKQELIALPDPMGVQRVTDGNPYRSWLHWP